MRWFYWVLVILYLLSPYDLFPDMVPGWGWADDLLLAGGLCWYFLSYRKRRRNPEGPRQGGSEEAEAEASHEAIKEDPYAVLGIDRSASGEEVRRAYRQLAAKYHPDKVSHLGEEFRTLAEKRFKEIKAAFDALNGSA